MPSCTRCGAGLPAAPAPCASCGAPAPGPAGTPRSPWLVLLLTLVTLGLYAFRYWSRAAREADAYARPERPAHKLVRTANGLLLASILPLLVGAVFLVGAGADSFDDEPRPRGFRDPVFTIGVVAYSGGFAMALMALVVLSRGLLRLWRTLREHELARGEPRPLRPGLQLLLVALPYVNLLTFWLALHRTQRSLNRLWAHAAPAQEAAPRAS